MKTIEQRQIRQMAAPVLLNYLLLTIFETLDKSIVGHYSVQGFAVIGIAETPIYEITGALGVLSSAFSMIAAQLQGRKNTADFGCLRTRAALCQGERYGMKNLIFIYHFLKF